MRLALFEPDIPQNAGSLMRLCACMGIALDIIEPCGFLFGERAMKRAAMDYLDSVELKRHRSWEAFAAWQNEQRLRLVLLTSKASHLYTGFAFANDDVILLGRESAGVPEFVHGAAAARLTIPMRTGLRSINVAQAGAMVLGEALRQTDGFPR